MSINHKNKVCPKCKTEREATSDNFGGDARKTDGFQSQCRICQRVSGAKRRQTEAYKTRMKIYRSSEKCLVKQRAYGRKFFATIRGHLIKTFFDIGYRCSGRENYSNIECIFETYEHFVDYVMNIMQVDPRGKQCHRIDNKGDYAPGNIEFLTPSDHANLHWATTRRETV